MRRILAPAVAVLFIAGTAGPAFGKAHSQPAASADFGQNNAAGQFDCPQNLDARGLLDEVDGATLCGFTGDDPKGVSGSETSADAKGKNAPVSDPR